MKSCMNTGCKSAMKFEGYLGPLGIVRTDVNQQEWIHIPQEIGGETMKTNCILMGLKSVAQASSFFQVILGNGIAIQVLR